MKKVLILAVIISHAAFAQQPEKAVFKKEPVSFYQHTIIKSLTGDFDTTQEATLKVDYGPLEMPTNPLLYNTVWYTNQLSQGNTGTCWSFSTSSFLESEIYRITGKEIDLSEMFTVYWEYVERTKYFVKNKGEMHVGEGSESNAIAKIMELYGAVPFEAYTGQVNGLSYYNHEPLFEEVEAYFKELKAKNDWDEDKAVSKVRALLDKYIGAVPTQVTVNGKKMTPLQYRDYVKIKPADYVNFMSLMEAPYYEKATYNVPDNWWRSNDYNNIPLADFISLIKESLKKGYSISIGGDVTEPGFDKITQTALVPAFDIRSEDINEYSRQLRFTNGATADDHAMHLVGIYEKDNNETWYLLKDSGSGSRNAGESSDQFGYYFMNEDYVKLKMLSLTVHKDAAQEFLKKMKK